jgi:hypothetical protein
VRRRRCRKSRTTGSLCLLGQAHAFFRSRITPSQAARRTNADRARAPGLRYDRTSYRRAVIRACDQAFPPPKHLARQKGETRTPWLQRLGPEKAAELKK